MHDSLQRALVSVRVTVLKDEAVSVFARSHKAVFGRGWSFDIAEPAMTGAESLLGVLASDVLGLFATLARKQRLQIDEIEATLSAELADPLVHLGVHGVEGEPRYSRFTLRAYAGTSAPEAAVRRVWEEAVRRAPLANTLKHSAEMDLQLVISA